MRLRTYRDALAERLFRRRGDAPQAHAAARAGVTLSTYRRLESAQRTNADAFVTAYQSLGWIDRARVVLAMNSFPISQAGDAEQQMDLPIGDTNGS